MVRVVNLTPHPLKIIKEGEEISIPPSGNVARVSARYSPAGEIETPQGSIPVVRREFGPVEGLPETAEEGTIYIVSSLVLSALEAEKDRWAGRVFAPDTGPSAVRDADGRIVGVTRLVGL